MIHTSENRLTRSTTKEALIVGVLLAALMAAYLLAAKPAHASTTFTVTNINDSGTGSLRQAILNANATTGADTIEFDIPGTGVHTITPYSQLPTISGPVSINGYSQPGAQPNTKAVGSDAVLKIELSGASAQYANGLLIAGSNSTVKGLVINRWPQTAIRIDGLDATGNRVTGNYLGTDASGTSSLGNGNYGVYIPDGSGNTIGGATAGARNVISANYFHGVSIDVGADGNNVLGNYIGTDATGTKDLGNSSNGIHIEGATNNTIGGTSAGERNVISGNDGSGIAIYARRNRVTGNYIGTDATGTKDLGNTEEGVYLHGQNNVVGGTNAGERNVISANDQNGVVLESTYATGNRVLSNYVGTDKNGTAPIGNTYDGVLVVNAPNNTVGGTSAGERNVISANKNVGVHIYSAGSTGNRVTGNYVGTDASGTKKLGNFQGVYVNDAPNNTIGGATTGERNVISANDGNGVIIYGSTATGNKVQGNYLGADKNGAALGNSGDGVFISGSSNNTLGGTTAGARNVISSNAGSGVSIFGDGATGDRLMQNSIFSNGGLGIDLGDDGPTANDTGDTDTGPNNLQNKPAVSSARTSATGTTIKGSLDSTPNEAFVVRFYANPAGGDEGKTFLGQTKVSTDGSGKASFAIPLSKVSSGKTVTATATSPSGDTSEFSAPRTVVAV